MQISHNSDLDLGAEALLWIQTVLRCAVFWDRRKVGRRGVLSDVVEVRISAEAGPEEVQHGGVQNRHAVAQLRYGREDAAAACWDAALP